MLLRGELAMAVGALMLFVANVVCVNLAGQVVFLVKGIKPRTWLEKRSAKQSVRVSLSFWGVCLVVLLVLFALGAVTAQASA